MVKGIQKYVDLGPVREWKNSRCLPFGKVQVVQIPQFGSLLAGAIVTETIFGWPGLGRLTLTAISNRDYALVQGCILAIGLTYVVVNLLTDATYALADPRMRR